MSDRFELVPFEGRQIMTIRNNDGIYVVMKPIVEALGLDWEAQRQRIQRHPVISKGACITQVPSAGGMQDAVSLHLEHFHGWLVSLNPMNIKNEEKRAVIIRYQERAFRVIFEHFHGRMGKRLNLQSVASRVSLQNQALRLAQKLQVTRNRVERQMMYEMLEGMCTELGINTPALADLGREAPGVPDILDRFFSLIAQLESSGYEVNHHRLAGMLAINLVEVREMFKLEGISFSTIGQGFTAALRASTSPRFIDNTAVNSRYRRKTVSCWVFAFEA
ncbi:phage antirepressor N-terminal domain-containing protein [Sphingomonas sanguinis]|uniref:phage antirepressor N-terminal domain-containing protein n=1 Tax=Sphingomonas sanguinis TaxID=33051 RepID=UPI00301AE762